MSSHSNKEFIDILFSESLLLLRHFFDRHIVVFFETIVLKEVFILRILSPILSSKICCRILY